MKYLLSLLLAGCASAPLPEAKPIPLDFVCMGGHLFVVQDHDDVEFIAKIGKCIGSLMILFEPEGKEL